MEGRTGNETIIGPGNQVPGAFRIVLASKRNSGEVEAEKFYLFLVIHDLTLINLDTREGKGHYSIYYC